MIAMRMTRQTFTISMLIATLLTLTACNDDELTYMVGTLERDRVG